MFSQRLSPSTSWQRSSGSMPSRWLRRAPKTSKSSSRPGRVASRRAPVHGILSQRRGTRFLNRRPSLTRQAFAADFVNKENPKRTVSPTGSGTSRAGMGFRFQPSADEQSSDRLRAGETAAPRIERAARALQHPIYGGQGRIEVAATGLDEAYWLNLAPSPRGLRCLAK